MIKDVVEGLTLVKDGIESVQAIAEAVKNGKDYLKVKHPEAQHDLREMVAELGKSLFVIKGASAVLTNFRFATTYDTRGTELARFNEYFIQSKTDAQNLRNHIDDLRSHCSKIREHSVKISGAAGATFFAKIFRFLGLQSPEKELELGEKLDKLAFEDFAVANSAERMLDCLEKALQDVQDTLGIGGLMKPENIPPAAALLAEYGAAFEELEARATQEWKATRDLVQQLE